MRTGLRLAVVVFLLIAAGGLCVHYGSTYDTNWPHPTGDQLASEYDQFVGERVLVIGEVQSTDPVDGTLVVEITDSTDEVAAVIEVQDTTESVEAGGTVQLYGILTADRTMISPQTVVVNQGPTESQYKLAISVVGILLAVGYFFSHWRVDLRRLTFEHRSTADTEPPAND